MTLSVRSPQIRSNYAGVIKPLKFCIGLFLEAIVERHLLFLVPASVVIGMVSLFVWNYGCWSDKCESVIGCSDYA